jgi:hypothetical protein
MKKLLFLFLLIIGLTSFQTDNTISPNTDKALIIGVAKYNHTNSWKYTDDDAYRLFGFHKEQLMMDENISIIIDEDATNQSIIDELTKVALSCSKSDNFFFYFGGHSDSTGIWGIDGIANNTVKYEKLGSILKGSHAKHKLLIINAAYSEIAEKSFDKSTTVFFAGSEGEATPESDDFHQTIFCYYLIRGLGGEADIDKNEIVTLEEFKNYVYNNVRSFTENKQNPKMINFNSFQWQM